MTWDQVAEICANSGFNFHLYTTFSHRAAQVTVPTDKYYKWAERSKGEFPRSPTRAPWRRT